MNAFHFLNVQSLICQAAVIKLCMCWYIYVAKPMIVHVVQQISYMHSRKTFLNSIAPCEMCWRGHSYVVQMFYMLYMICILYNGLYFQSGYIFEDHRYYENKSFQLKYNPFPMKPSYIANQ